MDFNLIIVAVATLLRSLGSSTLVGHYNAKFQKETIKIEFGNYIRNVHVFKCCKIHFDLSKEINNVIGS